MYNRTDLWVFKHHFQQYFSYIMVASFISGGRQITFKKKTWNCRKTLTNIITQDFHLSTPHHLHEEE